MKRLLFIALFVLLSVQAAAQSTAPVMVREQDSVPSVPGASEIVFPNGSVTKQGSKAFISFTAGGAIGGSGTTNTLVRFTSASGVGNAPGLVYATSGANLTVTAQANGVMGLKVVEPATPSVPVMEIRNAANTARIQFSATSGALTDNFTNISVYTAVAGRVASIGAWTNLDSGAESELYLYTGTAGTDYIRFRAVATGASGADLVDLARSGVVWVSNTATGGLVQVADAGPIIFATGGHALANERMRILSTGPILFKAASINVPVTLTDAATIASDATLANRFIVTLTGSHTLGAPTGGTNGQQVIWEICQNGGGGFTLTLDTGTGGFVFGDSITSYTNTTTASKCDYLTAIYNSTANKWRVVGTSKGF